MVCRFLKVLTLDRKIREQNTGTSEQLAEGLGISRTRLFEIKAEFIDFGADIQFDRTRKTFYYANDFNLNLTIDVDGRRVLTNDDMSKISGGFTFLSKSSFSPYSWTVVSYLSPRTSTFG
jgi:hypothetical protein